MVISIVLLLMALVFHLFTVRQSKVERLEMQTNMERVAQQIASIRLSDSSSWKTYQEWIDNIISSDAGHDIVYIAIMDDDHNMAAHALNDHFLDVDNAGYLTRAEEIDIIQQLSNGQIAEESWNDFDNINVSLRLGRRSLGKVEVGFSLIDFNRDIRNRIIANAYIILGALAFGVLLSIWLARTISKPLEALTDGMQEVSQGNLNTYVQNNTNDEIGTLSESFNIMTTRLREKDTLQSFSKDLAFVVDKRSLFQLVTEQIVQYSGSEQCIFFLFDDFQNMSKADAVWAHPIRIEDAFSIEIDDECKGECFTKSDPFAPEELRHFDCFRQGARIIRCHFPQTEINLILPLISQGEVLGFILLGKKKETKHHYDDIQLQFLQTLAQQAALAVRNALLLHELTEHERLQKELEIAARVQQGLLPIESPKFSNIEFSGFCRPAAQVGGDYYDYFIIDEHRIGITIADVSGKGTSAAFYMAELKGMVTSLAFSHVSPKKVVRELNKFLGQNPDKRIFTTMIYGILDTQSLTFDFVRAGHNALVRVKEKDVNPDIYIPSGLGLGLADDETFQQLTVEESVALSKGDLLFFYTDGLSEAMNERHQEFSEERLYSILAQTFSQDVLQIQRQLMQEINLFTGTAPQHDDITMILAKIL